MTLNAAIVQLPILGKIPLRDKYRLSYLMRKRSLLLHIMLRQGTSWYAFRQYRVSTSTTTFRRIRNLIPENGK